MISSANRMCVKVRLLRDLMEPLSMSEVATLTGVSKSTLSRLWDSPGWTGKAHHVTVRRLSAVVPGVAEYVRLVMHSERLSEVIERAERLGLVTDTSTLAAVVGSAGSPVALAMVVDAASLFAEGREQMAFRCLDFCWGTQMDPAVSAVFESGLIVNRDVLLGHVQNAVQMSGGRLVGLEIGRSIAVHKLIKGGAELSPPRGRRDVWAAEFEARSRVIGQIMADDDMDAVDSFRRRLDTESYALTNEVWSLLSYSGDVKAGSHPAGLARWPVPSRTALDVIEDVSTLRGAYAYYLVGAAIPSLLRVDSQFGGNRAALKTALATAAGHAEDDGNTAMVTATHVLRQAMDEW